MFNQSKLHPDIFSLIEKHPSGCWLWKGHIDRYRDNHGYGRYGGKKNRKQAHRLVYEMLKGPVPKTLDLDHLCRIRHCVNPSHLEPVTRQMNLLRGNGFAGINARKTHCQKGHLYSKENTAFGKHNDRVCLFCKRERNRIWMRTYKPKEKVNV